VTYKEALAKSRLKRIVGIVIVVVAFISTVVSLLRMLYFRLDDGTNLGTVFSRPFKNLVVLAHKNTQFLDFFWSYSPTPSLVNISDPENIKFGVVYLSAFVGAALYASGNKLAMRLRKIDERIEDQLIEDSIRGERVRTREEIRASTEIPDSSIFTQIHQLYFAPVVTTIIGGILLAILLKLMGL
jgi:YniB-like protein